MPTTVLTPAEIGQQIGNILTLAWQQARSLTRDERAQIHAVTQNPAAEIKIEMNSARPKGDWLIARGRDAEKIISVTIYFRPWTEKAEAVSATRTTRSKAQPVEAATSSDPVTPPVEVVAETTAPIQPAPPQPEMPMVEAEAQVVIAASPADPPTTTTPLVHHSLTPTPKQQSTPVITNPPTQPKGQLSLWQ